MLRVWEEMYYRLASYIDASFVIDPSSSEHKRTALWCISYKKDQIVLCELDVAQIDDFHSFFYSILLSYILDSIVEVDGAISDKLFREKTSKYCIRINILTKPSKLNYGIIFNINYRLHITADTRSVEVL
jgi:hypothetical protein